MRTIICANCGFEIKNAVAYCPNCGSKIEKLEGENAKKKAQQVRLE